MSYQSTHDHHADGNHGWDTVVAEVNHKQASAAGIARSDKQRRQTKIGHGWDEIVADLNTSKFE
jgi:hypothetical protein